MSNQNLKIKSARSAAVAPSPHLPKSISREWGAVFCFVKSYSNASENPEKFKAANSLSDNDLERFLRNSMLFAEAHAFSLEEAIKAEQRRHANLLAKQILKAVKEIQTKQAELADIFFDYSSNAAIESTDRHTKKACLLRHAVTLEIRERSN